MATNIPMRTIYNNLKKIEQNHGKLNRKKGSGRPKKISPIIAKTIGPSIRRDSSISLQTLETKLLDKGYVSCTSISRYLSHFGYNKKLPKATPMLTEEHKRRRVEWAQTHTTGIRPFSLMKQPFSFFVIQWNGCIKMNVLLVEYRKIVKKSLLGVAFLQNWPFLFLKNNGCKILRRNTGKSSSRYSYNDGKRLAVSAGVLRSFIVYTYD